MKTLTLTLVILLASLCYAQKPQCTKPQPPPPTPAPVTTTTINNTNTNSNTATSTSNSNSTSNSTSNSNSTSSASGGNASASNGNQTLVTNTERQAPSVSGGFIVPTSSCLGSMQAGASAPVGSIMFGRAPRDKECSYIRLANELIAVGNFEGAAKALCATKSAKEIKLTIDDCRAIVPKPAPVVLPAPVVVKEQPTIILYETLEVRPTPAEITAAVKLKATPKKKPTARKPCVPPALTHPLEK